MLFSFKVMERLEDGSLRTSNGTLDLAIEEWPWPNDMHAQTLAEMVFTLEKAMNEASRFRVHIFTKGD